MDPIVEPAMDLTALQTAASDVTAVGATLLAIAAVFIGVRLIPKAITFVKQQVTRG